MLRRHKCEFSCVNTFQISCAQVFGARFSKLHLQRYLDDAIRVEVHCTSSDEIFEVRMKKGMGTNQAIMTSGWDDVVKEYNFEEDDIVLFCFDPKSSGGLNLLLVHMPLEEEDDDEGEHYMSDDDTEDTEDTEEEEVHEISDDVAEDDHDIHEISDDVAQDADIHEISDDDSGEVADDAGQGDPYFQGTCVFGNKFSMNNTRIKHLKVVVDYYPNAPIPQYVYCLTQSSLNKMVSFLLGTSV
jgi:hypothetical protein